MVQQCTCPLHPDRDTAPGVCPTWTQGRLKPSSRDHCRGNNLVDFSDLSANLDDDEEVKGFKGMRFGTGKWNGIGEYISVNIIVHNVARSLAPRHIVKICFLPFLDKIDLECKKYSL